MGFFNRWKLPSTTPPTDVVQAAYALYGLAPEQVFSVQTRRLKALSEHLWVVTINERDSALVVATRENAQPPAATVWFDEAS